MPDPTTDYGEKKLSPSTRRIETDPRPDSGPVVLAICGDPVVGRALVLLLRNSSYEVRYLSAPFLRRSGALENIRLLLLTPALDSRYQKALSEALENNPDVTRKLPTLKLVASTGGEQESGAPREPEHVIHWPCTTEELKQRIEAILSVDRGVGQASHGDPKTTFLK